MTEASDYKLWGSRFVEPTHQLMERINASINFDKRLYAHDIRASQAHTAMLGRQGVISLEDVVLIIQGLDQVKEEIESGQMAWRTSLEDIHTHVEARLKELIGEAAGRLHIARSRNDQVATDLRLWAMAACRDLDQGLLEYQRTLVSLAEAHALAIMPGYTHLQRAQPVLFAHHMLAYLEMAQRDRDRLADCYRRAAVLPLGAAALAGTTYPIDPATVAQDLGFSSGLCANSLDAVSDRDFAAELLFALTLTQVHLSRLAEELILWSTSEFGFVRLADAFSTGSSIMPQKKNPDAAELIRGKTGRVLGDLVALLTVLKGLPLAYNKDLQEDKEPVFDAVDTVLDCLHVLAPMLESLQVREEAMAQAVRGGFLNATELADYLAARGVPFRQAHEIAGRAVLLAERSGRALENLSIEEYKGLSSVIEEDVYRIIEPEHAVNRRLSSGGTAGVNVRTALMEARKRLWPQPV
ncbi:Argininosuccinate lyase [Desulfarculales bacterium]